MSEPKTVNTSRRAFFLKGSAAIGATLATATAGATSLLDPTLPLQQQLASLHQQLATFSDIDALRHLHQAYSAALENQAYATVVELFTDDATVEVYGQRYQGKQTGIRQLFVDQYGTQQAAAMHTAFRQDQSQRLDQVSVDAQRQLASATFHSLVEVSKPLQEQSVLEQMARQQGMHASSSWEQGRFVVACQQVAGQWLISKLEYQQV